ncbi:hypothetical protein [Sporosalibacterium faouarense]|uniref:hypothetical protein n=1 Tax=Sporosalibacterium faouarense TaxID=516123 RepID=UPI00192C182A|nr:hypothetical protein [Sporosalibacterium faouarense]
METKLIIALIIILIAVIFVKAVSKVPKIVFMTIRGISLIFGIIAIYKNWDIAYPVIKEFGNDVTSKIIEIGKLAYFTVINNADKVLSEIPNKIN